MHDPTKAWMRMNLIPKAHFTFLNATARAYPTDTRYAMIKAKHPEPPRVKHMMLGRIIAAERIGRLRRLFKCANVVEMPENG
jgi:hypothetical protein